MHFFDTAVARLAQDFKARAWESIQDHQITQEDIAAALGVEQSTVSRWMSVAGDLHLPAFAVPALADERVLPLRKDLIDFIARRSAYVIARRLPIVGTLNGSLDDETMELTAHLGRIAEQVTRGRLDARRARHEITKMREALDRAEAELEAGNGAG